MTEVNERVMSTKTTMDKEASPSLYDMVFDSKRMPENHRSDSNTDDQLNNGLRDTMRLYRSAVIRGSISDEMHNLKPANGAAETKKVAVEAEDANFQKSEPNTKLRPADIVHGKRPDGPLVSEPDKVSNNIQDSQAKVNAPASLIEEPWLAAVRVGDQRLIFEKYPWSTNPSTGLTMLFAKKLRFYDPKGYGPGVVAGLGTVASIQDARRFWNAKSGLQQGKYGTALMADTSMVTGAFLVYAEKMPKLAPALIVGGIGSRILLDLVPDRIESDPNRFTDPKLIDEWALQEKERRAKLSPQK